MKKYFIEVGTVNKAKEDIDEICRREGFCNLTSRDVVRHPLVQKIVKAYEDFEDKSRKKKTK